MQEIAIEKINDLGKKLKISKNGKGETKLSSKDARKRVIQPQQLYI
jgi:hypothetical protein